MFVFGNEQHRVAIRKRKWTQLCDRLGVSPGPLEPRPSNPSKQKLLDPIPEKIAKPEEATAYEVSILNSLTKDRTHHDTHDNTHHAQSTNLPQNVLLTKEIEEKVSDCKADLERSLKPMSFIIEMYVEVLEKMLQLANDAQKYTKKNLKSEQPSSRTGAPSFRDVREKIVWYLDNVATTKNGWYYLVFVYINHYHYGNWRTPSLTKEKPGDDPECFINEVPKIERIKKSYESSRTFFAQSQIAEFPAMPDTLELSHLVTWTRRVQQVRRDHKMTVAWLKYYSDTTDREPKPASAEGNGSLQKHSQDGDPGPSNRVPRAVKKPETRVTLFGPRSSHRNPSQGPSPGQHKHENGHAHANASGNRNGNGKGNGKQPVVS